MSAAPPDDERAPDVVPALPEGSLLLHIGPPKTGSTAIQMALHESRAVLAEHGVLYPGTHMRERSASQAIMGSGPALGRPRPRLELWQALVDEMAGTDLPRICLSHENFSRAEDAAVATILESLREVRGHDRVHVVYVARRLDKILPSHWQEKVKAWLTEPYEDFLHRMLDEPLADKTVWPPHEVAPVVARWAERVGADNVTIIVADEQDHGLIPRTFEAMLDLPAGMLVPPRTKSNISLSYTESEAVRRLNAMAHESGWTTRDYWQLMQTGVVKALRERDRSDDARIVGLPAWAFERVAERADRQIDEVRAAGVRVIGDPERLRVSTHARPADLPADVDAVPLDLLAAMVRGAVDGSRAMHARERRKAVRAARRAARTSAVDALSGRQLLGLLAGRVRARTHRNVRAGGKR